MNAKQLAVRDVPAASPPNYNELERAEYLAGKLERAIRLARQYKFDRATLVLEEAEELLQLMRDGLRTAKAIQGGK